MSYPRKYSTALSSTDRRLIASDWDAMVDAANGMTASGVVIQYPYSFTVRNVGGVYDAVDGNGIQTYGGSSDAGGIDGADPVAVIQACIDNSDGYAVIHIIEGEYTAASTDYLEIDENNPVCITGSVGTYLKNIGIKFIASVSTNAYRPLLCNIVLDGVTAPASSVGLTVQNFHHSEFYNVHCKNWDIGVKLTGPLWIVDFYGLKITTTGASTYGLYVCGNKAEVAATDAVNAVNFFGGGIHTTGAGTLGISVYGYGESRDITFFGTDIEPATTNLVKLRMTGAPDTGYTPRGWVFQDCTFESYEVNQVFVLLTGPGPNADFGPRSISFRNCRWNIVHDANQTILQADYASYLVVDSPRIYAGAIGACNLFLDITADCSVSHIRAEEITVTITDNGSISNDWYHDEDYYPPQNPLIQYNSVADVGDTDTVNFNYNFPNANACVFIQIYDHPELIASPHSIAAGSFVIHIYDNAGNPAGATYTIFYVALCHT